MPKTKFLQIHTLHSYPAALLNRDDSGLAKRMTFGGAVRTRISSQCLKRHWRMAEDEFSLHSIANAEPALRSRNVIDRRVIEPLGEAGGIRSEVLTAVANAFNTGVYGNKGADRKGRQPLLLGLPEVEYLQAKAKAICDEHPDDPKAAETAAKELFSDKKGEGKNFSEFRKSARLPGGLAGALFGRMVTSDTAANIDAAVHVAHAFTVHKEESESDYFSVMDDLKEEGEDSGADHINQMELTAGLFYGYAVVDVPGLVSNLEGCPAGQWNNADREMAAQVIHNLIHLIAKVSPGAKLGSTAPYERAVFMLTEAGSSQPRSLANAYRNPLSPPQIDKAVQSLSHYLAKQDDCYGAKEARRVIALDDCHVPNAERVSCDELAGWAADAIRRGETS